MKKYVFYIISFIIFQKVITEPKCIELKNNCIKCHPTNNLCIRCNHDIFTPDQNGGCEYFKNCVLGQNYCEICNPEENICQKCPDGYFPDEYGGCSYTFNCEISYRGECLKCKEDYILIGQNDPFSEGLRLCKSLFSEDFKFCDKIDTEKGKCIKCKEGYYLNESDKKCCPTKNCKESIYGVCQNCILNYYLDRRSNECKEKKRIIKEL